MTNLTKKEIQVLRNALNYEDRESQLDDNHSDSCLTDDAKILKTSKAVVRGVYLSLYNKGMGHVVEETEFVDTYFQLSEKGVNAIFDYILYH